MTMTSPLTPEVTAALEAHRAARSAYLAERDVSKKIFENICRHRTAAQAAANTARTDGARWREALREAGGELTPAVRKLRSSATENGEIAEELDALAAEVAVTLRAQQAKTAESRMEYLSAREKAEALYLPAKLESAFYALFDTPEAKELIGLLSASKHLMMEKVSNNALFRELYGTHLNTVESQQECKRRYTSEVRKIISDPFMDQLKEATNYHDAQLNELNIIPFAIGIEDKPESLAIRHQRKTHEALVAKKTAAAR